MLDALQVRGFDVAFTYHADAILREDFGGALVELEETLLNLSIPIDELVGGGGGEAKVTQRLRRALAAQGWRKEIFRVEKKINDRTTFAQTHEIDHVKAWPRGTLAMEIEWNNKDPFFDRDLENFSRLHADGAISVGVIVTRGASLQDGLRGAVERFATERAIAGFDDLRRYRVSPTERQRQAIEQTCLRHGRPLAQVWAEAFVSDKFGAATTHWNKLKARLDRGVGSPCPLLAIGIPIGCVSFEDDAAD